MKIKIIILLLLISTGLIQAQQSIQDSHQDLMGSWTIDLRPGPDAEGYFQPMIIKSVEENRISGTFYGSEIIDGFINSNWNRIYFAFSTADNSYTYYHSGYMQNGRLYGISYCPGRAFTAPWNGVKMKRDGSKDH